MNPVIGNRAANARAILAPSFYGLSNAGKEIE